MGWCSAGYKEASKTPALLNIAAIKAIPERYASVISEFTAAFTQITTPLAVLAFQRHPITHNLWALRHDRLVEISKSGVQLQRRDGKCLHSGIALCPGCQWAPSGSQCRPCTQVDVNSWAWNAKCKNQACTGRRLLADARMTSIRFILTGNHTVITSYWPDAVQIDLLYNIVVTTSDPIAEMRRIREILALITITVQVVTQPYESILVDETNAVTRLTLTTVPINKPPAYNTTSASITPTTTPNPQPIPYPVTRSKPDTTAIYVIALAIPLLIIVSIIVACNMYHPNPVKTSPNIRYRPIYITHQRFHVMHPI